MHEFKRAECDTMDETTLKIIEKPVKFSSMQSILIRSNKLGSNYWSHEI